MLEAKMNRYFYLFAGHISLFLACLGLFFPLLPTTPFLLLSAFCYLKGSPRMYQWLMNHKLFGEYLRNYEKKQINRIHRRNTLIVLYLGVGLSMFLINKPIVYFILPLIAIGVTLHLMSLKGV